MTRNEHLQWVVLEFGLSAKDHDLGRATTISELCQEARVVGFACSKNELLDALYTLPREYASLIKLLPAGEETHPVSFERIRNTMDWPDYFSKGEFHVKVLPEGISRHHELSERLEPSAMVK